MILYVHSYSRTSPYSTTYVQHAFFIQFLSPANTPDASQVKSTAFEASRVLFPIIVGVPAEMDGFVFTPTTFLFHISTLPEVGTRVTAVAIYYLPGAAQESAQLSSYKGPIRLLCNQAMDFWQLLESECYPDGGKSSMPLLESERNFDVALFTGKASTRQSGYCFNVSFQDNTIISSLL